MTETRKIAADPPGRSPMLVGYSRLAGADEDWVDFVAASRGLRSDLIDPAIAVHHGHAGCQAHRGCHSYRVPQCGRCGALRNRDANRHGRAQCSACRTSGTHRVSRAGIHLGDVVEENDGRSHGGRGEHRGRASKGFVESRADLLVRRRLPASQVATSNYKVADLGIRRPSRTSPSRCAHYLLRHGPPMTQKAPGAVI